MTRDPVQFAYAGVRCRTPVYRLISSWLASSWWWIASVGLGLGLVYSAQIYEFVRRML